jgi:hypothetical protein
MDTGKYPIKIIRKAKALYIGIVSIIVLLGGFTVFTNLNFFHDYSKFQYFSDVWRHRGGEPENNISAIKNTLLTGYRGIEVDVFYANDRYYLSHDGPPKVDESQTLDNLLGALKDEQPINIWVDFKNMGAFQAIQHAFKLKDIIGDSKHPTVIETKSLFAAGILNLVDIHTCLWLTYNDSSIKRFLKKVFYKIGSAVFNLNRFSFHKHLDVSDFGVSCEDCHILLFTENRLKHIKKRFKQDKRVKVYLTDLEFSEI